MKYSLGLALLIASCSSGLPEDIVCKSITTQSLRLVDDAGRQRASFEIRGNATEITLLGDDGKARVTLSYSSQGALLLLADGAKLAESSQKITLQVPIHGRTVLGLTYKDQVRIEGMEDSEFEEEWSYQSTIKD